MLDPRIESVRDTLYNVAVDTNTPENIREWAQGLVDTLNSTDAPLQGFAKGDPLPNSIGALADHYAEVRDARLAMDKQAAAVKERESEVYKVILSALSESPDSGAAGTHHRVQLVTKKRENVADWDAFYQFVKQTGAFEMLQRRLSNKAVVEYLDDTGQLPPGVQQVDVDALSFTKV